MGKVPRWISDNGFEIANVCCAIVGICLTATLVTASIVCMIFLTRLLSLWS